MEQYIVSARKYRPATFDSVVGQQALTSTLKNAITTGRLAHAYLFCGTRGVGKTSCARIFAKTINCTNRTPAGEACNECDSCRMFNEGRSMNIVELDAASNNGVEPMRELVDQVMTPPAIGRYRVFIIDEVHMLSTAAFNAFLKTLEEPPAYVVFILATTEKHKIIPTILSRCQIYDFNRISVPDIVGQLQRVAADQGITAEPEALNVIATKADGGMRDALSIFDQIAASGGGHITYADTIANLNVLDESYFSRLMDAFVAQNVADALLIYRDIRMQGFDSQQFIGGLAGYLRDLSVAQSPATLTLIEGTDDMRARLAERASKLHPTFLYRAMDLCNEADFNFRLAGNKQLLVELMLIKLCQLLSPGGDTSSAPKAPLQSMAATPRATVTPAQQPQATASQAARPAAPQPQTSPASQPAQAPRPAATVPPQPAPRPAPAPTPRPGGMSLGAMKERLRTAGQAPAASSSRSDDAAAATPEPAPPAEKRTTPYTAADLDRAWAGVAEIVSSHKGLASTMHIIHPVAEGNKIIIHFPGKVISDMAQPYLPAIRRHLSDILANDVFELVCDEDLSQLPPELWPDEKIYTEMLAEHPALREYIAEFGMRRI